MGSKKKKSKTASSKQVDNLPPAPLPEVADDELLDDLFAQIDEKDSAAAREVATTITQEAELEKGAEEVEAKPSKKDSKARFEARKLRKAAAQLARIPVNDDAELDKRIEEEARNEEETLKRICDDLNVELAEVIPDGHCLYASVADQLRVIGVLAPEYANYATTRAAAAAYISSNPDSFLPFLPSTEGEDGRGPNQEGIMGPLEFQRYCTNIRDTAVWGGEPEILALSRVYNIPIHVVQSMKPYIVKHDPPGVVSDNKDQNVVRISYHRRMYGLGEHYNSLRPKTLTNKLKKLVS